MATQAVGSFSRWPIKCPSRFSYLLKIKKSEEPSAKVTSTSGFTIFCDLSLINEKDGKYPKWTKKYLGTCFFT